MSEEPIPACPRPAGHPAPGRVLLCGSHREPVGHLDSHVGWIPKLGARCVAYMGEHLRLMRPVWVAEGSNPPLLRLDARLGFVPVDEIIVFHPPRGQDSDAALRLVRVLRAKTGG